MKTISKVQWQRLDDLAAEGFLGGLPLQIAEKDIHITDLLSRLSGLQVRHRFFKGLGRDETDRVDDGIHLIFSGGTCLSKVHGIINRMSEDIDIKVSLRAQTTGEFKKDFGPRGRLKALHAAVELLLSDMDFEVPTKIGDQVNPTILNTHRHYDIGAEYSSLAPPIASLRPQLKLEMMHREPRLPTTAIKFGFLYERFVGSDFESPTTIQCIQVSETLAEKVVSLLRRCAWKWDGHQRGEMDPALVRHVYDVYRIMQVEPGALTGAQEIFAAIVEGDVDEYGAQHPSFVADPKGTLSRALATAKVNDEFRNSYTTHLLPLVYQGHQVTFDDAYFEFEKVAVILLGTLT
jgi:hypothetical protein